MIPLLVPTNAATDTPQAAALPSDLVGDDNAFAAAFAETGTADIHSDITSEVEVKLPLVQDTNDAETDIDESTKPVTGTDEPPQVDVATPVVAPVPVEKNHFSFRLTPRLSLTIHRINRGRIRTSSSSRQMNQRS